MSQGIHLILLGAPGVGKGTQAERLKEELQAAHVSTGNILRAAVAEGTQLGLDAKGYMDRGELVPDDVILGIIKETLSDTQFPVNWMMDGFPRNLAQSEAFGTMLSQIGQEITAVVNIDVPKDLLMERLTLRRTCRKSGRVFHLKFNPPSPEDDVDLYQRDDDREEAVAKRLEVYEAQTKPLIEYYTQQGSLVNINGNQSVEAVFDEVMAAIKARTAR